MWGSDVLRTVVKHSCPFEGDADCDGLGFPAEAWTAAGAARVV